MKSILILCAVVAVAVGHPGDIYNPEYDNFNAQELVENTGLLKNYGKCFLNQGPCTKEGTDFKDVIPQILQSSCVKCTPKQCTLVRTIVHGFQEKLPDMWKELVEKYDPKGKYKEDFKAFLNAKD